MKKSEVDKIDYKKDVSIDRNSLHHECIRQPQEMAKYVKLHSQAMFDRDKIKRELSVSRAETEKDVRMNPETYEIEKVTESAVKAAVDSDEEVKIKENALIESQYAVSLLGGALESFRDRRKALEGLITLLTMGYWNIEPRPGKEDQRSLEQANTEAQLAALDSKLPRRE